MYGRFCVVGRSSRLCRALLTLQSRVSSGILDRPLPFLHVACPPGVPLYNALVERTFHLNSTISNRGERCKIASCDILTVRIRALCSSTGGRKTPSDDPATATSAGKGSLEYIRDSLATIQTSLQHGGPTWKGYNVLKILLALAVLSGLGVYLFRDEVRQNVAEEVSNVATRSMADEELVTRVNELSKALVNDVLNDENILNRTKEFSSNLIIDIMADEHNQEKMGLLLKNLILKTLSDENMQKEMAVHVKSILSRPEVRDAVLAVIQGLFNEPRVQQEAADFFKSVLASDTVQGEATELGRTISSSLLRDDGLQKEAGNMMWGAFKYSFTPTFVPWTGSNDGKKES
ncbi:Hypp2744 [Branchiostoma lanceolatum]|uniref:Hypp2744 protein n=1 Tax=Branchiostoma lanceolatum TaxID=7740 RepID=A0A8J9ZU64_BRALA|nr:Hypp2744 [Branchiostoma lanceolatum]